MVQVGSSIDQNAILILRRALNTVFASLLENPFQFPLIEQDARPALVRDFPYGVFFTTAADLITVLERDSGSPSVWPR